VFAVTEHPGLKLKAKIINRPTRRSRFSEGNMWRRPLTTGEIGVEPGSGRIGQPFGIRRRGNLLPNINNIGLNR